jgi:hypothetical protein
VSARPTARIRPGSLGDAGAQNARQWPRFGRGVPVRLWACVLPAKRLSYFAAQIDVSPSYLRKAIREGIPVHGTIVKLDVETIRFGNRVSYRVYPDQFGAFLRAIGWSRIPSEYRPPADAAPSAVPAV